MARGVVPRQPAKTGRQEGARVRARENTRKLARTDKSLKGGRPKLVLSEVEGAAVPKQAKTKASSALRYDPLAPGRVQEILQRLDRLYPDVTCALHHKSAWELVVATILSAQSTDVNVNRVTPELFKKYPTVQDFAALTPEQLQPDIYSTGFFRNKAKSVVGAAKRVVSEFSGQVPDDMEKLLTLPGVARKTANVVLGELVRQG